MSFEANAGQTDRKVKFLARGQGYGLFLTSTGAVLSLNKSSDRQVAKSPGDVSKVSETSSADERAVLSMELVGANRSPQISGIDVLPGKTNYFVGNDPAKWSKDISTYSKVRYSGVYPGIDVVYYGNQRQLEYDFVVAPGKDPRRIKLAFKGISGTSVDASGNLMLSTSGGEVRQVKPFAYQDVDGERREVAANYRVGKHDVTFEVSDYNRSQPLIIDPVLVYSSFLGGSNLETGVAIAVDAQGSAYLTGRTFSSDFPTANAFQPATSSFGDAFVVKLNPGGTAFVYSTYLGGNSDDSPRRIAIDGQGSAYIAGGTLSDNFPVTPGALQNTKDTWLDGFVTKLNPTGSSLVYSTFLGGDNGERIFGLAVGTDGRASVAGLTDSSRFSTNPFPTPRGGSSAHKSVDNAGHWSASGSGLTASAVNSFAVQTGNSNIVYAGTNTGVFKSTDAGANWALFGSTSPSREPLDTNVVLIDPSDPSIIYAGAQTGVYKSTGGALFAQKNNGLGDTFINALVIDPTTPTTLYAGTSFAGIYKSTDGGDHWGSANLGGLGGSTINELVIDPTNSAILYAGTNDGMYKTLDSGGLWSPINSGPLSNFPNEITALAIDPVNPMVLYAAVLNFPNLVKTTDGGTTWVGSSTGLTYTVDGVINFAFPGALAIDPATPTILYAATVGGGIFKSTDGGANWSQSNTGLTRVNVNGVAVDPNNPATVFAGATIGSDAFAARLNASGSGLDYLVNFGGDGDDSASGVALDLDGNAYIAGTTTSPNFPTVNAFQSTLGSSQPDAFVAKLNSLGTNFVYSTYLGGSSTDTASDVAVRGGSAYVVGHTFSPNFPLANAFKSVLAQDDNDGFLTKLNAFGSGLDFSTYLGGNSSDEAFGVAVDSLGGVYVTGSTFSLDYPTLAAPQSSIGGNRDAFVTQLNDAGTQLVYSTYLGGTASDIGNGIAVDPSGNTYVLGVTNSTNFPTANPFQAVRSGNSDAFFTKIAAVAPITNVQFTQSNYAVSESGPGVQVTVSRTGETSSGSTVEYTTADTSGANNCNVINGNASSRCDYETTAGTLHFAAGETSKTITIPIIDDAYAEGGESFTINLSNPTGTGLGSPSSATITINDNEGVNGTNPIDQAAFFVRQHYIDFFSREPDAAGLAFWTNQITECELPGATCSAEVRRINVSAAFFLSIEFQETGYLVERLYKSAYGEATGTSNFGPTHQLLVPIVRFNEFLPDTQQIGNGVVIGQPGADQLLESNKVAFIAEFVQRTRFTTVYPSTLTPAQFVDALFANTGVTPSASERTSAIDEFGGAGTSADVAARARALRKVAENASFKQQEINKAFVLMQYFGYLRRNPNDPQDTDYSGYDFWLTKLNQFNGNFVNAEMVKAFIISGEYRARFGQ